MLAADTWRTLADSAGEVPPSDVQDAGALTQLLWEQIDGRLRAEQAAAMWQERSRNLEAELARVLALPAHEQAPKARRRWWERWRHG